MTMPQEDVELTDLELVRRRVRSVVTRYLWREMDVSPMTDAILAEIDAAGYVLVDRQHYARLQSSHARRYAKVMAETVGMPEGGE